MANNFTLGTAWVDIRGKSDNLAKDLAHGIKAASRPVKAIGHALTGGGGATGIGALFGPEGAVVGQVIDKLGGLFTQILSLAGAANPVAYEQFNSALKDLWATIGRQLVPVLRLATQIIRAIADAFARLQGLSSSVGLGDVRTPAFGDIASAKNAFATEALRASTGAADPTQKTADNTSEILSIMQGLLFGGYQGTYDSLMHLSRLAR